MLNVFLKHKFLTGAIIILLLLSIICQIAIGVIYQNMISDTDNMSTTKNKLLKQCKLKFANCYKLNGKMVNTTVFVDKFIQKIRIANLPLIQLTHMAGQFMMLSVLVTGISICLSLASGDTLFQIIPYYLSSILGLYMYFSISGVVDIPGKKNVLKINLIDYLENHLAPRLEIEKENALSQGENKRESYLKAMEDKKKEEGREEETVEKEAFSEVIEQDNDKDILNRESEYKAAVSYMEANERSMPTAVDYQEELESLLEEFFA